MSAVFARPEGPGSGRRGLASRVQGTCVFLAYLAARSRASADAKRSGEVLGPFGKVPRPPGPNPPGSFWIVGGSVGVGEDDKVCNAGYD